MTDKNEQEDQSIKRPTPKWVSVLETVSSRLNKIAAGISAILLVLMVGLILVEIVLRFFSLSTFMTDVLVGHGVAAVTFLAAAWALEEGSMIRISAVTQALHGRVRWATEAFCIVSVEILIVWLMYFEWRSVAKLWARGTTSEHYLPIPLWIPAAIFLVGLALLGLQILVRGARLISHGYDENSLLKL
ncbi:TRAP transporter small permease [Mariluticola halotolerans]|uniref:TRAP transporter small permease n=1 Tax=Mariluticola halotolerans TaxID=2909283 RepID=UPI0026E2DF7F|nr:TRAP transporter small permease [Mariluticola halotolerans]UJQ95141.1 TRAP transporter small permease [Mariluticola halotolerans]